ncbi:hypothetical protein [Quadrisphaera sp. KR29]|uniref:hypothetical protein n=1 Tax=Quadrisphaera sp. KR29 TaxID=3461391 RepID=UPI0040443712
MGAGREDEGAGQPRLARRGVLLLTLLGAATLVAGLVSGSLTDRDGSAGPAPYGVAGCERPVAAAPVDVTVTARAVGSDGAPTGVLGGTGAQDGPGGGLQVGASVRDLAGYAARAVVACEVVQVTVYLHDATGGGAVPGSLERADRLLQVEGQGGRGRVAALDWRTWEASLPEGARAGELQEQASWLVTLLDPQPGTYRLTGRVTASGEGAPATSGDVEVLLTLAPHAG